MINYISDAEAKESLETISGQLGDITTQINNLADISPILIRDILRVKMRQTGLNPDYNAWSDTLEDLTGIATEPSSGYMLSGGNITFNGMDSHVKVLLHMNGTNGSTTFTDESGKIWIANGNMQINTAQKKFGTASGLFDGTGAYIKTPYHADFLFGSDSFTIDCWIRITSTASYYTIYSHRYDDNNFILIYTYQGRLYFQSKVSGSYIANYYSDILISTNTWKHIAVVRNGINVYLFVDGTNTLTTVNAISTSSLPDINNNPTIGAIYAHDTTSSTFFNGSIDEFRLSKGIARWTSNFNVQTSEYSSATEATIIWNSQTSLGTLSNVIIEAIQILNTGNILYYISRDAGTTYTECPIDTITDISSQPNGTSIVLKAVISGNAELLAIAWGG